MKKAVIFCQAISLMVPLSGMAQKKSSSYFTSGTEFIFSFALNFNLFRDVHFNYSKEEMLHKF